MRRVRVLHIITRLDRGGSAENTLQTVLRLSPERYEVELAMGSGTELGDTRLAELREAGFKPIIIPALVREVSPLKDIKALLDIYCLLRRRRYDIVHTHTSKAGFIGRLAAFLADVPVIIHTPHGHVFGGYFGKLKERMFLEMERLATPLSDQTVALTRPEADDYVDYGVESPGRITVIPSGIDYKKMQTFAEGTAEDIRRELGIPPGAVVIGSVGRLAHIKGYDIFLNAAKSIVEKIPGAYFVLVGEGPEEQTFKSLAAQLGLAEKVLFTGMRTDAPRLARAFDLFVLPARNEGMGRVLVEAMFFQRPIVATSVCGIPELVRHGETGLLAPPENPEALARAVLDALERPEELRRFARTAFDQVIPQYSIETMIGKIGDLYEKLLATRYPSLRR